MIRLVGIDVDGTLVGSSGVVNPRIWQAADAARAHGIHLALCSGRPAFGVAREYAQRLEATGWHIFQNGASVVHLANGQSRSATIPQDQVRALIHQARATGEVLELYSDATYVTESDSEWARVHAELLGVTFAPQPFESLDQRVVRAQWLLHGEQATRFATTAPAGLEVAQSSSPLMPDTQFVGLTRAGVTKGTALRTLADSYGILLDEVMYVGDSGNDLSALRIVGHPVAMGNADPAVRHAATHTVGHVDAGGLAEALELATATSG